MATVEERVAKGVALLDDKRPGWRSEINTDILVMSDSRDCLLGQLYGDYGSGLQALDLWVEEDANKYSFGTPYGFTTGGETWNELHAAWDIELLKGTALETP